MYYMYLNQTKDNALAIRAIDDDLPVPCSGQQLTEPQPFHNVLITTSDGGQAPDADDMLLFPAGSRIPSPFGGVRAAKHADCEKELFEIEGSAEMLVQSALLPRQLSARAKELMPRDQYETFTRQWGVFSQLPEHRIPTILICGHGGRDQRCGITGPILKDEFNTTMNRTSSQTHLFDKWTTELISHIGAHKFAGNVIMYFPQASSKGWDTHPLAGMGVWYGRVAPKHVDGIVEQTLLRGKIIKELFRGGIDGKGGILRLANVETAVSSSDL